MGTDHEEQKESLVDSGMGSWARSCVRRSKLLLITISNCGIDRPGGPAISSGGGGRDKCNTYQPLQCRKGTYELSKGVNLATQKVSDHNPRPYIFNVALNCTFFRLAWVRVKLNQCDRHASTTGSTCACVDGEAVDSERDGAQAVLWTAGLDGQEYNCHFSGRLKLRGSV